MRIKFNFFKNSRILYFFLFQLHVKVKNSYELSFLVMDFYIIILAMDLARGGGRDGSGQGGRGRGGRGRGGCGRGGRGRGGRGRGRRSRGGGVRGGGVQVLVEDEDERLI